MQRTTVFVDRRKAGKKLAEAVKALDLADPVVLTLPRDGVPIGFEVAQVLGAPLDILLVRKIGAPGHDQCRIGALVDGASPQLVIDEAAARVVEADQAYSDWQVARQFDKIERRRADHRTAPPISLGKRSPRRRRSRVRSATR